ncbi:hypothetical protein ACWEQL_28910 [Kitasatospora sp. NPDC004240]
MSITSSSPFPHRSTARRLGIAALTLWLPLTLGGCVSQPDKNEPLPVMARQEAQDWARHMTEYMAQTAGVTITPDTVKASFRDCVGKNDEVATDGRYTMSYAAYSSVSPEQHGEAVRKIRPMLEQQGFEIKGYREELNGKPDALLDAFQPAGRYLVSAETTATGNLLLLRVSTRCLMPPTTR